MKLALMKNAHDIIVEERVLPEIDHDELLLKVDACGICGTDRTSAIDGWPNHGTFGHEIAATVLGSRDAKMPVGARIVLDSSTACGRCTSCKDGNQELCTDIATIFRKPVLGFSEQMIAPVLSAVPYAHLKPEYACLAEPLGVALDMHRLADIAMGSHVVVSGLGTIGLMAIRLARLSGAERIYACGTSRSKTRQEAALAFGADEIIEVDKTPLAPSLFSKPPDRFMVTAPPKTIPEMIAIAGKGAIISYIGIKHGEEAMISFDANQFHFNKLQLRGSFAAPAMRTPEAVRLLENGTIDAAKLVTHVFEFSAIAEAVRVAVEDPNAIKVVVNFAA
ncbi:MAG TPA: alcohol dehydrogenase catalytic domain-containing protein [Capsulimonadaceae bacterium]|jgi:threonine dehydrogenase-like Zn-dependent dehydrogenase